MDKRGLVEISAEYCTKNVLQKKRVGKEGEAKRNKSVGNRRYCVATNKICFKVCVYNVPDILSDRGMKM